MFRFSYHKPESTPPASPELAPASAAFTTASESESSPQGQATASMADPPLEIFGSGGGPGVGGAGSFSVSSCKERPESGQRPATASRRQLRLPVPSDASSAPIRLLAGYSGRPRTDSAGRVWNPDRFFSGGGNWQRTAGPFARTSDPFIFEHSRTGDFFYSIPLKPGSYELHLFFSIPQRSRRYFQCSGKRRIPAAGIRYQRGRDGGRHCR